MMKYVSYPRRIGGTMGTTHTFPSGPIPPIRGKCPEGTKRVGMLSAKLTERIRTLLFRLYQRRNGAGQRIRLLRICIGAVRFAAPLLRNSSVAFGDSSFYTKEPLGCAIPPCLPSLGEVAERSDGRRGYAQTLSVSFADSSPKGRAKDAAQPPKPSP